MKKKNRFGRNVFLMLCCVLAIAFKTLYDAGEFSTVFNHPLPACVSYKNVTGPEDLTTVDDGRIALVSAADRLSLSTGMKASVYRFTGDSEPTLIYPTDGIPHGIASTKTELGSRVFLVVHKENEDDRVEILDWVSDAASLKLSKTVRFKDVENTLNGIAAIDENKFVVSQDFGFKPGPIQTVEKFLRLSLGKLWYYDGQKSDEAKIVREGLLYPNGVAVSSDLKQLYLASLTGRKIIVYDMKWNEGQSEPTLEWRREWALSSGPDNLKWANGELLVGAHRRLLKTLAHSIAPKRFSSPSQLLRIKGLPDSARIEEIHATKGEDRSTDVAAISGGVLLSLGQKIVMGGIYTEGLLACEGSRYFPPPPTTLTELP